MWVMKDYVTFCADLSWSEFGRCLTVGLQVWLASSVTFCLLVAGLSANACISMLFMKTINTLKSHVEKIAQLAAINLNNYKIPSCLAATIESLDVPSRAGSNGVSSCLLPGDPEDSFLDFGIVAVSRYSPFDGPLVWESGVAGGWVAKGLVEALDRSLLPSMGNPSATLMFAFVFVVLSLTKVLFYH